MKEKATSKIFIENESVKVTGWRFKPGAETGWHVHEYDYVVVPMIDGTLKIEDRYKGDSFSTLKKGNPYFRKIGVEHNVININDFDFSFIEIELK